MRAGKLVSTQKFCKALTERRAVISFVAAGLGAALVPEQIKRLPHEGVIFLSLRRRLKNGSAPIEIPTCFIAARNWFRRTSGESAMGLNSIRWNATSWMQAFH